MIGLDAVVPEPMSDRLLILDIDGVLIPFDGPSAEWGDWVRHPARRDLIVSREMIRAIDSLGADVCWATSWAANANAVVGPFIGWPSLPTLTKQTTAGWWKVDAVDARLASAVQRRIAWVDDDIGRYADVVRDRLGRWVDTGRVLTVRPSSPVGLSRDELDSIRHHFECGAAAVRRRQDEDTASGWSQ